MPYVSPTTVVTGTTIASAWGNSVKAALDYQANVPALRAIRTATQAINNGTQTSIQFTAADEFDTTGTMHNPAVLPERVLIPDTGIYSIGCHANFAANVTGDRVLFLARFGGATLVVQDVPAVIAGRPTDLVVATIAKFTAGDQFTAEVFQTSGGALNVTAAELFAVWVGLG